MPYKDPQKQKAYQAKWYQATKAKTRARMRLSATACKYRNLRFIKRIKERGCTICGYKRCPDAIDFHHVDSAEKEMAISKAASQMRWSISRLKTEIRKCVRLCANCHRELHAGIITIKNNPGR